MALDASMVSISTTAVAFAAAVWDVQTRRIPNWFTGPTLLFTLLLQFYVGGWHCLGFALSAALIAGAVFLIFFLLGGMGGGDVKLIAVVAAGVGLRDVGTLLVFTALCGGAMAVVLALRHGRMRQTLGNIHELAVHHTHSGFAPHPELHVQNERTLRLPYAVAIAAGTFLTLSMQGIQR
jgi:prepilin peptidase CpaA